jgi:arsenite methyltransferase
VSSSPPRRGNYGFDAPCAPLLMVLGGACLVALSVWNIWQHEGTPTTPERIRAALPALCGLWLLLNAGLFVYATRVGKFAAWSKLLDRIGLAGSERLLDIGCRRGAVLLMAAQRLR